MLIPKHRYQFARTDNGVNTTETKSYWHNGLHSGRVLLKRQDLNLRWGINHDGLTVRYHRPLGHTWIIVAGAGLEPAIFGLWARRVNRFSTPQFLCRNVESNHGYQCFKLALYQLSYLGIMVDQMRIELTTGALQVLLAPLDHAGPLFRKVIMNSCTLSSINDLNLLCIYWWWVGQSGIKFSGLLSLWFSL